MWQPPSLPDSEDIKGTHRALVELSSFKYKSVMRVPPPGQLGSGDRSQEPLCGLVDAHYQRRLLVEFVWIHTDVIQMWTRCTAVRCFDLPRQ